MQFVNGVNVTIADDGTTFMTFLVQWPGQEELSEIAKLLMSETTALMIADTIQKTSRQKRDKIGLPQ